MTLYATFKSNTPNFSVEFIELLLKNGNVVSLDWDESGIQYTEDGYNARYKGVYFNEEYANGRLSDLENCKVIGIEIYTEESTPVSVSLCDMLFIDGEEEMQIEPHQWKYLYSAKLSLMNALHPHFNAYQAMNCDVFLIEKQADEGMTPAEIISIAKKLDTQKELLPIEVQGYVCASIAMGFITYSVAELLSFDYSQMNAYIASILDDMENETPDGIYTFDDIKICIKRG